MLSVLGKRGGLPLPLPYILFFLVFCVLFWQLRSHPAAAILLPGLHSDAKSSKLSSEKDLSPVSQDAHPIKQLRALATAKFDKLVQQQSTTLKAAVAEYKRRYGRPPPKGFDKWYEYAKMKETVWIDEFDMINESMAPFWKIDASDVRTLVDQVWEADGPSIMHLNVTNGKFHATPGDWMGENIANWLVDLPSKLPDMRILINPMDEPRVLIDQDPSLDKPAWILNRNTAYQRMMGVCDHKPRPTPESLGQINNNNGVPFITDLPSTQDICQNPSYKSMHGFLVAPSNFLTTGSPVAVFSQAKLSTFSDVMYPSIWYWTHEMGDLEQKDPKWTDKKNKLYWVGSTTGLYNRPHSVVEPEWESHRHRFIRITREITKSVWSFLTFDAESKVWKLYRSDEILSQLYNTKFTSIVQCDGDHCENDKIKYQIQPGEDGMIAFNHKFVMDLDGNSFSGRFYNLLASNSCPLKQTLFREWHDERIFPWVHYVPISLGLEELPETMRYLALTTEGSQIAQDIAQAGKRWQRRSLRKEDCTIYLYRLLLEYARVISDDRDTMNYELP